MSREESEDQFIGALEDMLLNDEIIGVNSISKKTGLNKVLLYRYFGGLDGLLEAYAKKINLWQLLNDELISLLETGTLTSAKESITWIFKEYRKKLLSSPLYLRLLREELFKPNVLTKKLEDEREIQGVKMLELISNKFPGTLNLDSAYNASFIVSGITYLALKSTQVNKFTGLDFRADETWDNFDKVWESLIPD